MRIVDIDQTGGSVIQTEFADDNQWYRYLLNCQNQSIYPIPTELKKDDIMLTLLTCSDEYKNGRAFDSGKADALMAEDDIIEFDEVCSKAEEGMRLVSIKRQELQNMDDNALIWVCVQPVILKMRGRNFSIKHEVYEPLSKPMRALVMMQILLGHSSGGAAEFFSKAYRRF